MKVTVLGAGFDALLAVHAASILGHDVRIVAESDKPEQLVGAQILRAPIPMVDVQASSLVVEFREDIDTFMDKLLNQGGAGKEPEIIEPDAMTWYADPVYRWLWETYGRFVQVREKGIGFADVEAIKKETRADYLISGIDRDDLCGDRNHSFAAAPIVYMQFDAASGPNLKHNRVIYNGSPDEPWCIESIFWGEVWRGYGAHRHPPVSPEKIRTEILPQGYQCDCHAVDMDRVGKLGMWDPLWQRHWSFYRTFNNLDGQ